MRSSEVERSRDEAEGAPPEALREKLRRRGQEHLLRFWRELRPEERSALRSQIERLDWKLLEDLSRGRGVARPGAMARDALPAPVVPCGGDAPFAKRSDAVREGERLLAEGKVGIILVAGGQGSRLGFPGPKGCYPIGPVSGKSLFQLQAEQIAALRRRYGRTLRWYVMTSPGNDPATREFFSERRFFGLPEDSVRFFPQTVLPSLDSNGRLILETKCQIFENPDGHGGVYAALLRSGLLDEAERSGIEHLFHYQVDNALIRIADPVLLGFHALSGADMSLKVLRKSCPEEKIGVVVSEGAAYRVVEYSDLSEEEAARRDARGELVFWAGSIAIHAFRIAFFRRAAEGEIDLPYHAAWKEIPSVDESGHPAKVRGCKYERFVFDALPAARNPVFLEVRREEEFAPVKNPRGVDSVESARGLLLAEHRRWLERCGVRVSGRVEVSPLAALDAGDLEARLPPELRGGREGDFVLELGGDGRPRFEPRS
ncbi:MAG: UTP--glucose-1-phosphate uridylyltransferase [Planctomycetota bacterium]